MKNRLLCSTCLIAFLLLSICICAGGARFVKELRPSVAEQKISKDAGVRVAGEVYDINVKDDYQILFLKNVSIIYQNESFNESRIIVYDENKLNIEIGNQTVISGDISFYEGERNPGNFNQKFYYQKQEIHASVWAADINILDDSVDKVRNSLYQFRMEWKELLCDVLGEEDGAILSAMLLADKNGMDEETKELYQVNGIAHVLAISGLHLSIIGIGLYKIFRRLSGSYLAGGMLGVSFLILYILMIGVSVSVVRALIMFLFRVGADMTGRHYDSPTALAVAALLTIIWKPLYLFDGGFWLSYGAILAIILVLPMFEQLPWQGLWASVSINLVTVPILLYYFYEIPLYSVILNMAVIPLMTAVLVCGLAGSVCCIALDNIGNALLWICKGIFDVYDKICYLFVKLPFARIIAGRPQMWKIMMYYICLLMGVAMWKYRKRGRKRLQKWWKITGSILVFSIGGMIVSAGGMVLPPGEGGEVSVTMLDVSQGDGLFIRGPKGNTYLVDGGSSDVKKVGKYRIEPFLKSQGIGKIDYVFVSHGDGDHVSGIIEMIERMDVGVAIETIVLPQRGAWDENILELARLAIGKKVRVVEMTKGQVFTEGKMTLTCLAPGEGSQENVSGENSNASSMVLALKYLDFDMLFTGDVEEKGEENLTEVIKNGYQDVKWDVLKVAHHGSKNSSEIEFLDEVCPGYSLISAGRDNSYGHPHAETIERLENAGSKVWSTKDCGAIMVVTNGKKMSIERYLEKRES